jgi:tRNA pseudouridine32 synthase/23S rRNA pseudouridine746 synthase
MQCIDYKTEFTQDSEQGICDLLATATGLPKMRIKDAMAKGAVHLQPGRGKQKRLRRATYQPRSGDKISLHYQPEILALVLPPAQCLEDFDRYSVWYKPAGVLSQGNQYSDHTSLLRQAELHWKPQRTVFLVHRLDREASGLMLIAHDQTSAAKLSQLFVENSIQKIYRAGVRGRPDKDSGTIDLPLDGKPALTEYTLIDYDVAHDIATVSITLKTGRLHQIRRHFDMIGHPLIGDPKYGRGNKDAGGMRLIAEQLEFRCPLTGKTRLLRLGQQGRPEGI